MPKLYRWGTFPSGCAGVGTGRPSGPARTFHRPMPLDTIRALVESIRDAVIDARTNATGHAADVVRLDDGSDPVHGGDTIYRLDLRAEEILLEWASMHAHDPRGPLGATFAVIAEGLPGDGWATFPAGTPRAAVETVVIVDPIDGTRGLMHGKRSAWALAAAGPGPARLGRMPRLRDLEVAAMAEVPTPRARLADTLWARRGGPVRGTTLDFATGTVTDVRLAPSGATDLAHGFASVAKFFPGTKVLAAEIEERLFAAVMGDPPGGAPVIFDDQYISSGGQLFELAVGHDRFVADLRPYLMDELEARDRAAGRATGRRRLCCRPYDLCTVLIAEAAGVIVTDGRGGPVDAPLDTTSDVSWAGYANRALHDAMQPALTRLLDELLTGAGAPPRPEGA